MKITNTLLVLLLATSLAFSKKQETIDSDRPGKSYSSTTLGKEVIQIQTGLAKNHLYGPNVDNSLAFSNELRLGLSDIIEINANLDYSRLSKYPDYPSGFSELGLGFRSQLLNDLESKLSISLVTKYLVGINRFSEFKRDGGFLISANIRKELNDLIALTANLRMIDDGVLSDYLYGYTLNSTVKLSDLFSFYLEIYGTLNPYSNINIDGGLSFLLTEDILIDASVGFIEFDTTKQWFGEYGVSFRLGGDEE